MNEILGIITLVIEALIILQCIQIVFGKNIKADKYVVMIIIADVLIYTLINLRVIPVICSVILYLLFYLLCYYKFKLSIIKTIIRLIISFSLMGCVESLAAFIPYIFITTENSMYMLFLSATIALSLVSVIKTKKHSFGRIITGEGNVWKFGIIIFYSILLAVLLFDYHIYQNPINIYIVFALTFMIFIFFYTHRLEHARNEIAKKTYDLQLQKVYGGTYENLLFEVRRRQHDYKNQLGAIYGMHLTAKSLENLIHMQKKYGDKLLADCKFDSILTCCNNSILAGFIYYKCVACEKEDVEVDYNIHIEQAECKFAVHEIIEILGILIDNAYENVKSDDSLEQRIRLEIQENQEKINFFVSNPSKYVPFSKIDTMFTRGYSTKGENRGIGLERVRELINKHDAEIAVYNSRPYAKDNWINFVIEIKK